MLFKRTLTSIHVISLLVIYGSGLLAACNAPAPTPGETVPATSPVEPVPTTSPTEPGPLPNEYRNATYGFGLTLPESWSGYSATVDSWTGYTQDEQLGDVVIEQGPLISIHHPASTPEQPRQEIPVMIFTTEQWESLQGGTWWVSAAPIGPLELARNNAYVFALPPRYNYAFLEGWEEVEQIIAAQPFQVFETDP